MSNIAIKTNFSAPKTPNPSSTEDDKVAKMVNFLLMQTDHFESSLSKLLVKHMFNKRDDVFLKQFKTALQKALDLIDLTHVDKKKELFIASIIALVPYAYPKIGDSFRFPVKNQQGHYQQKTFICDAIVPMSLSTSIPALNAYGFKSTDGDHKLIFTGTTAPSNEGFLNSLLADFTPFSSVGKLPFNMGFSCLKDYFKTRSNVQLLGKSLGGALCLHTLIHFEAYIKDVYAIVPAGLHIWDRYNKNSNKKVVIAIQEGDIVSKLGYFPEHPDVEFFHLKAFGSSTKGFYAHARSFAGSCECEINTPDVKKVNRSLIRTMITVMHIAFSWLIFIGLMPILFCYKLQELSTFALQKFSPYFRPVQEPLCLPL